WVRVNFNNFISEEVFAFIVKAASMIATDGWRLLPDYRFDVRNGRWLHRSGRRESPMSLDDLSYRGGRLEFRAKMVTEPEWALAGYLDAARAILDAAPERLRGAAGLDTEAPSAEVEELRWFVM